MIAMQRSLYNGGCFGSRCTVLRLFPSIGLGMSAFGLNATLF